MGNSFHDERGRFTTGESAANAASAKGDHLSQAPADKSLRNVPGHGVIERSVPVARHANTESVNTTRRLSAAARDAIIRGKGIDQRHYPQRGADATAATDLGRPMGSLTATPGRFKYQK